MKKLYSLLVFCLFSAAAFAQPSQSIAVVFYVDANNNCTYNTGEVILYNVQAQISYSTANGIVTSVSSPSFQSCSSQTLYCWNSVSAPINTITVLSGGVTQNPCGNYTNVPYNTNNIQYLPVILSGANNVGAQVNIASSAPGQNGFSYQNVPSGNTISICSNFGFDSLTITANIGNLFSCSNTNTMSPRTFSLYCDNVLLDWFTVTGGVNSNGNITPTFNNVTGWHYYTASSCYLTLNPNLPSTFTTTGTHTLQLKSTLIYNNPASYFDYKAYFVPIPCSRISGRFYNDCNNNCVFDAGDSYGVGFNATGYLFNGNTNITFNPDLYSGRFDLIVPAAAAYSLTQYPTTPATHTACTTGTITIPAVSTVTNLLFGYRNNLPSNADPAVSITRISSTTPSISPQTGVTFGVFTYNWMWYLCNNNPASNPGVLKVVLPKFFSYVSNVSGPTPTVNTSGALADTLIYAITNFSNSVGPIASFSAVVSATAVAGTQFAIAAYIYPTVDINVWNNFHQWTRTIGGPFDPNGKYCQVTNKFANGNIPFGTQDFIYEIGFQNIGSGPAINVTTLDTIDSNFDLSTLKVLQSSFPVSVQKDNNSRAVQFHFHNINLPGSQYDEPNSHGFVRYYVKLKPGVNVNTTLKNRAHNYFDLLDPVATNQTSNKLVSVAAVNELGETVFDVKAIPNPFSASLKIESDDEIQAIKVYNISGQLILEQVPVSGSNVVNMSDHPAGMYIIKLSSINQKTTYIKVVKE